MALLIRLISSVLVVPSDEVQDGFPISTDRPSFADGTLIIPKGRWQVESGATLNRVGSSEVCSVGELLFRFPVHEKLELRVSNLSWATANASAGSGEGVLDPVLGVKYRFQSGVAGQKPDQAIVLQSSLPVGLPELGFPFGLDQFLRC
ncbi:MAG TPA: hypothetical protein PKA27_11495 [Fimbriimonadaceae bacterium]|nr:hypothetical protein [Fimbriimonadaceae bacterium]